MQIVVIMGNLCSGKSTYAQQYKDFVKVEVSDIVRKITQKAERVHNPNLDIEIMDQLFNEIHLAHDEGYPGVAITGIRQVSILNFLESMAETMESLQLHRVWLEVPADILKARYEKRADRKDRNQTYEECCARDNKLGLAALADYLKIVNTHTILNYNPDEQTSQLQTIQEGQ